MYDLNGMDRPMTEEETADMFAKAPIFKPDISADEHFLEIEAALIELAAMTAESEG